MTANSPAPLVPVEDEHIPRLYEALVLGPSGAMWRTRGLAISMGEFVAIIRDGSAQSMVGLDPVTRAPVVVCSIYTVDGPSGLAGLSVGADLGHPRSALVTGSAVESYLDYLFCIVGLRKVSIELPAPQAARLAPTLARWEELVHREGLLRDHVRIGAEFHDVHVFGIFSDEWLRVGSPHLAARARPRLGVPAPGSRSEGLDLVVSAFRRAGIECDQPVSGGAELVCDLGVDSLSLIEALAILEDDLDVCIDATDPQVSLVVLQDLVELVERAVALQSPDRSLA